MTPLTTLEKVKLSLGITDASKDAVLTMFIGEVSALIATLCGRNFLAEERTEIYDLTDGTKVFLKNYPLIAGEDLIVEYRTGLVGTPVWVPYTINDYYVYPEEGYLDFESSYRNFGQGGKQALRVTYTGGFLIDFANEGDPNLHNLPFDITGLATSLSVSMYNDRASGGIKSESTEGQSITYEAPSESTLTTSQLATVSRYKRYLV